jgi:hypothetical protein
MRMIKTFFMIIVGLIFQISTNAQSSPIELTCNAKYERFIPFRSGPINCGAFSVRIDDNFLKISGLCDINRIVALSEVTATHYLFNMVGKLDAVTTVGNINRLSGAFMFIEWTKRSDIRYETNFQAEGQCRVARPLF